MDIADTIQRSRKKKGLSQSELGEKVGLSTSSISWIETGRREPTSQQLESIADELDIPLHVLSALSKNRVLDIVNAIKSNPYLSPRAKRNLIDSSYVWARDSKNE